MTLHIGFTGTQAGMTGDQLTAVSYLLQSWRASMLDEAWLHHGDCVGADAQAHSVARQWNYSVHLHPPIKESRRAWCDFDVCEDPRDFLDRNHDIVDANAGLIGAPRAPETLRSGTWATLRYAHKLGKPVFVVWPDGSWETDTEKIFTLHRFTSQV